MVVTSLTTKIASLFLVMICLGVFISLFAGLSLTNFPPYSDYTYTGYANTTSGIINKTQTATRVKTIIVVPTDTSFAKSEYLYIALANANAEGNTTGNVTLNGASITAGLTTAPDATTAFTFTNISCNDGLNTITAGSTNTNSNLTLSNATIVCATGYVGTNFTFMIVIAVLLIVYFILRRLYRMYRK